MNSSSFQKCIVPHHKRNLVITMEQILFNMVLKSKGIKCVENNDLFLLMK